MKQKTIGQGIKPEIDKIIEKYLPRKPNKKWLEFVFGKPNYSFDLKAVKEALTKPLWNFLDRGGKRWRPFLLLLMAKAVNRNAQTVKDILIIPELAHNGSLIVDDLEDDSQMRRGKPCLHKIFGADVAINAGNFIYFLPLLALVKNKHEFKKEILLKAYDVYFQELMNLHLGQAMDIYWHKGKAEKITEAQYLQMCAFKTGCLPRLAAKLAVLSAGGKNEMVKKMGRLAESIGIAFQIQDDILDLTSKEFFKNKGGFGNDITEGKRTLIIIHALRQAKKTDKKKLLKILNAHSNNQNLRNEALAIINKYRSLDYAKKKAQNLIKDSWKKVDNSLKDSASKRKLKKFIDYLIERKI